MNRYKWTSMFTFMVRWSYCRKYGVTSHQGTLNWVTHIYISNGDGVVEDRLVLRFTAIPAFFFFLIIPLCDTC